MQRKARKKPVIVEVREVKPPIMKLENDWNRLLTAWQKFKERHGAPDLVMSASIYDLRAIDREVNYSLRRLLNSPYKERIRLYGAPSRQFGKHPFRYDGKVWYSVRIIEVSGGSAIVGSQKEEAHRSALGLS